ncbi:MAG: ribosome small subunit-dependent GTPase A [Ruminococcaceae bacterium]|nr:ribosome small subunit-dependent GTPase A [Oscillospiraceae bacterium]
MLTGYILKGIGGFYYVKTPEGIIECRARGNFRKKDITPCVGDLVDISTEGDSLGYVINIHERKNHFIRPPISNVDTFVIVFSAKNPDPDFVFVDKLTVIAKKYGADVILCVNKSDLCDDDMVEKIKGIYENSGFDVIITSAKDNTGIDELTEKISNKLTAFCGFSGVGKSSILSRITGEELETGDVSKKLKRGKHTTRCVELLEYKENSFLADTPGFSNLELSVMGIRKDDLEGLFPEFNKYLGDCYFTGCSHRKEKGCCIKDAVDNGDISQERYSSYVEFYDILSKIKDWE